MYHPATQTLLSITVKDYWVASVALEPKSQPTAFQTADTCLSKDSSSPNPIINSD